jgi:hypothetical protein
MPATGLDAGALGADVFGHLGVSTASAWSVLLSLFGNDGRYGQGSGRGC